LGRRGFLGSIAAGLAGSAIAGCRHLSIPFLKERYRGVVARGAVTSGDRPLAGVRVSDGHSVVATDAFGNFEIPLGPMSGPFIFVVTPANHWTERFWAPIQDILDGPLQFKLRPHPQSEDFKFLFVTDIHLGEGPDPQRSFRKFAATLAEIDRQSPPAFLWFGGDLSIDEGRGTQFMRLVRSLDRPFRCVIGDHDLLLHRSDPHEDYHFHFGPSYYSFDWGRMHCIALDGMSVAPGPDGNPQVVAELAQRELEWLEEDLRLVPGGMPSVVAVHVPFHGTYAERRPPSQRASTCPVVRSQKAVTEVFRSLKVPLVLQGHVHENERIQSERTEFVSTVAISGRRWLSEGREFGVSGEPRGYRRVHVRGPRVWHEFVSSAESRVDGFGEVVGNPEVLPRAEEVPIVLNLYDGANDASVSARYDEGAWIKLDHGFRPEGEHQGVAMAHHWLWTLDTRSWYTGQHLLQFRVQEAGRPEKVLEHTVETL
jgi:calcineurin-like phosphoesterase family protein